MYGNHRDKERYSRHSSPSSRSRHSTSSSSHRRSSSDRKSDSTGSREDGIPNSFVRERDRQKPAEDNLDVLQRMKKSFANTPLDELNTAIKDNVQVKIWTRNYKEVRGMITGYIVCFDKHWNIVLRDTNEVYLKKKKSKAPYLEDLDRDTEDEASETEAPAPPPPPAPPKEAKKKNPDKDKKKRKRKKRRNTTIPHQRQLDQVLIRGDNVVMIQLLYQEEDGDD